MAWHRFDWWAAAIALPMLAILIGLGSWQLVRLEWKQGLLAEIERTRALPPVPLATLHGHTPAADTEYRAVILAGVILPGGPIRIGPRVLDGAVGDHLIVPAQPAGPGLPPVLVNLGWVPPAGDPEAGRIAVPAPGDRVEVLGRLRTPLAQGAFQPDNDPASGQWYWTDRAAMARAFGLERVLPQILHADPAGGDALPRGDSLIIDLPNRHFQYALTWFAIAGALVVIFTLYQRRRLLQS